MERLMRRELRRFLLVGWTMLDVPAHAGVNLALEWKRVFGHLPPRRADLVRGFHFRTAQGRAIYCPSVKGKPVAEPLVSRACAVVAAKYDCEARPAFRAELPAQRTARPPSRKAYASVELWPPPERDSRGELVYEFLDGGLYVPALRVENDDEWVPATTDPSEAHVFESRAEAEDWAERAAPGEPLQLRYRAAAIAEFDLREAEAAGTW